MNDTIVNQFFVGEKFSTIAPLLKQIEIQQGLNISRVRELKIAKRILVESIIYN